MSLSISGLHVAISSKRRLHILAVLKSERCLTLSELSQRVSAPLTCLLYEIELLSKNKLVEIKDSAVICISEAGQEVIKRIASLDQDMMKRLSSGRLQRIIDYITLRPLAVHLQQMARVSMCILFTLLALLFTLLNIGKFGLALMIPVEYFSNAYVTIASLIATYLYVYGLFYIYGYSREIIGVALCYSSLLVLSSMYVPIRILVLNFGLISGAVLVALEFVKLVLITFAVMLVSNIISYSTGRPFENIFLIMSSTLLIPALILYITIRLA